jgi:hypothetical protein
MTTVRLCDAAGTRVRSRCDDEGTPVASPTDASGTTPKVIFPKKFLRCAECQAINQLMHHYHRSTFDFRL